MGRYTGPSCKKCRRRGIKLFLKGTRCETAKCAIERRNFAPGSNKGTFARKASEYGRRLSEKQKLRYFYGVSERQMRIIFERARKEKGVTGHILLALFERRIDNVLFRSKIAKSRQEARQLIGHGHFVINATKMTIASHLTQEGDVITMSSRAFDGLKARFEGGNESGIPEWLILDEKAKSITLRHSPKREEIDVPVEEQLIIEYYSR